jgi:hypothetical protein
MSAPPLPDVFGNYALGEFAEVVSPADISWLPQTAGWAWLGVLLLVFALHRCWRWFKRWHRNRYRREATTRLEDLSPETLGGQFVAEVNKLLKLAAMAAYSRENVASLYGDQWAGFLNRQCESAPFSSQQTKILATGAYKPLTLDKASAIALLEASVAWVREHREATDG